MATAATTAEGEGNGAALGGRSVAAAAHASAAFAAIAVIADGEHDSEGEGSSDDAKRTADARPDHWQRGGVPLATQNAIAEVNAPKAAHPMSQGLIAARPLNFAFGGPGQPPLPERERSRFPASQSPPRRTEMQRRGVPRHRGVGTPSPARRARLS